MGALTRQLPKMLSGIGLHEGTKLIPLRENPDRSRLIPTMGISTVLHDCFRMAVPQTYFSTGFHDTAPVNEEVGDEA